MSTTSQNRYPGLPASMLGLNHRAMELEVEARSDPYAFSRRVASLERTADRLRDALMKEVLSGFDGRPGESSDEDKRKVRLETLALLRELGEAL